MSAFEFALTTVSIGALLIFAPIAAHADDYSKNEVQTAQSNPDSGTMKRVDGDEAKVLKALQSLGGKPIETLSAPEARQQPTPTDAVKKVLISEGKDPEKLKAKLGVQTKDLTYPASAGDQPARVYMTAEKSDTARPVILYFHGGGFVIADINVYDEGPRALAKKTGAIVVSAEYSHAPEHKFPTQQNDAFAAYQWVLKNAASWGGDPTKIAVAGESAGGNLAANVAIMARDKGAQIPTAMALIYPIAGTDMTTESYQVNKDAKPLNAAMMGWFVKNTISSEADKKDPRLDLVHADLKNLPPAVIITDSIDPLMSEGKMLADNLKSAGNKVDYKNYAGVTHEFFGMDAVVGKAKDAQDKVAGDLKDWLKNSKENAGNQADNLNNVKPAQQ